MTVPPPVATTPAEDVLRRLDIDVSRRLDGLLHGDYRGLVAGQGSEPADTRRYQPGDDVRRIDWNVTARLPDVHVRETVADRELQTWLLLDRSASLDFGTARCEKRDLALAAAAAIGFLTLRTGNRFGAVTIDGDELTMHQPGPGRRHLLSTLHRLVESSAADAPTTPGRSHLAEGVDHLRRAGMTRRGLAVVISDFLTAEDDDWARALRMLARRHETLAVEVVDPRELALPDVGVLDLVDPETGRTRQVQTGDADLRERYAAAATDQRAEIARRIRASGADHLVLRTDRDWLLDLVNFVVGRRARVRHRPPTG